MYNLAFIIKNTPKLIALSKIPLKIKISTQLNKLFPFGAKMLFDLLRVKRYTLLTSSFQREVNKILKGIFFCYLCTDEQEILVKKHKMIKSFQAAQTKLGNFY